MVTLSSRSYKLGTKLYLNEHLVSNPDAQVVNTHVQTNHVYCCDVSGSMYSAIPKMREQLKSRIKELLHKDDTITIIAFADGHDCYVVKELAPVAKDSDIKTLNSAIDKYLTCHCCTDFMLPIEATKKVLKNKVPGVWNWIFLSDGGHNCGPFSDVIKGLGEFKDSIADATIIEYGYWADSKNLTKMAEKLGGTKIAAEDFVAYVPVIETTLKGGKYTPKVEVSVDGIEGLKYPQYFYIDDSTESIHVLTAEDGKLYIPTHINSFYSISTKIVGVGVKKNVGLDPKSLYAAAYVMSDTLHYDTVDSILATSCDTKFITMCQDAFGKQKLFECQTALRDATFNPATRGKIDPDFKPADTSYCVVDFINDLCSGDNYVKVADPAFSYKRIGAKQVDKVVLTDAEKQKLMNAKTKKDADKVSAEAAERTVKMEMVNKGYPISDFTWNEERANLSALMKIDVKLTMPKNNLGLTTIDSFIFRNYTIIRDGILNVNSLPLILDKATFDKLTTKKVNIEVLEVLEDDAIDCIIDFSNLPVLNKKRVRASKMKRMTKLALQLNDYKFELKYLGYLKKQLTGTSSGTYTNWDPKFTKEQVEFLASYGITDKGYSPKKEVDKNDDFYMALTLNSNFKGFSTIPPVENIDKKIKANKKLTPSEEYLQLVMKFIDQKYLSSSSVNSSAYIAAVNSAFNQITIKKRKVAEELSQMKFAMIVSRKWFSDCESFDDNTDTITSDFGPELTIEYKFVDKKQNL